MPFVRIRVIGLDQMIGGLDSLVRDLPNTRRDILKEAADYFYKDSIKNVHVITGKTKKSIRISKVDDKEAIVEAAYGARFEEVRPGVKPPPHIGTGKGPHNFMTQASKRTVEVLPNIVSNHIDKLFSKNRRGR